MQIIIDTLLKNTIIWAPRIGGAIVIFLIFLVLAKLIKRIIIKITEKIDLDNNLLLLLARASSITLIIFGLITGLGTLGIDISAIVAGLGLTGFALGFALRDIISNLLSGVLILLYRPFKVGNQIAISGYEGIIIAIDLRYTELDADGKKILIPNSKLFTDPITVID